MKKPVKMIYNVSLSEHNQLFAAQAEGAQHAQKMGVRAENKRDSGYVIYYELVILGLGPGLGHVSKQLSGCLYDTPLSRPNPSKLDRN